MFRVSARLRESLCECVRVAAMQPVTLIKDKPRVVATKAFAILAKVLMVPATDPGTRGCVVQCQLWAVTDAHHLAILLLPSRSRLLLRLPRER